MERRAIQRPVMLRAAADGAKLFEGYAAVFYSASDEGTEYQLWADVAERIDPAAFSEALKRKDDAAGLFNHDPDNLLGRVSAGTLKLSVDKTGLRYQIPYDDQDPDHQRVARKIERGDLAGSSFAFRPTRVEWVEEDEREIRIIKDLELFDVGPVTYPAYRATTAATRSDGAQDGAKQEHQAWKQHKQEEAARLREQIDAELETYQARLTMAGIDP